MAWRQKGASQRRSGNRVIRSIPGPTDFQSKTCLLAPQCGPTYLTLHVFRELDQRWSPVNLNSKGLSSTKEALVMHAAGGIIGALHEPCGR